jgi:AcrR family transcriptional regulator
MSELDSRQRLLEAAGQKFASKGFDSTNVREITEAAGTSPGSINYHFRSKEDLYIEAVRYAAAFCEKVNPHPQWAADVPPEQRLRDFIHVFVTRMLRQDVPEWCRVLIMREVGEPRPGACEEFVRSFVRPSFTILNSILRDLVPPNTPPETIALLGHSVVGQCLHYHHARHVIALLVGKEEYDRYGIERLAEHIWRFSLAAVRGLYPQEDKR